MLNIYFGDMEEAIYNPAVYFINFFNYIYSDILSLTFSYSTFIVNLHVSLTEIIDLIRNSDEWIQAGFKCFCPEDGGG